MHAEDMLDNSRFVAVIFILGRFIYKNIQKNCTLGTSGPPLKDPDSQRGYGGEWPPEWREWHPRGPSG